MKRFLAVILCLSAFVLFAGCDIEPSESNDNGTTTSPQQTAAPQTTAAPDSNAQVGSGTIGDYSVTIKGFKLTKDYDNKPAVYVDYEWTNNSDDTKSFMFVISDKVFQGGVECETAILMSVDGYDSGSQMKEIRPGTTFTVQAAYVLNDTQSPIEIELTELFSFASKKQMVTQTYDITK